MRIEMEDSVGFWFAGKLYLGTAVSFFDDQIVVALRGTGKRHLAAPLIRPLREVFLAYAGMPVPQP